MSCLIQPPSSTQGRLSARGFSFTFPNKTCRWSGNSNWRLGFLLLVAFNKQPKTNYKLLYMNFSRLKYTLNDFQGLLHYFEPINYTCLPSLQIKPIQVFLTFFFTASICWFQFKFLYKLNCNGSETTPVHSFAVTLV